MAISSPYLMDGATDAISGFSENGREISINVAFLLEK